MSKNTNRALNALLRWRELEESRAAVGLASATQVYERAKALTQSQALTVEGIQRERAGLMEGSIDPAVLQLAAAIEDGAWKSLEICRSSESVAHEHQEGAHQALVDARAHTRVVEARHVRVTAVQRDREEKAMFDRMADLHTLTRSLAND